MLLLFDIDGTLLLGASEQHRDSIHAALREVHGVVDPAAAHVKAPGRTDGEISRQILLRSGVSAERIDDRANAVRDVTCREFARRCPDDLREKVAPGIVELLAELDARDGVRLALVTGNFEPIARLKMNRAGLGDRFEHGQGAFGSDHEDRAELPALARARAGANGEAHPRERTVVIGDTPNDIACAQADGVRCLAVATGPFQPAELEAADAVAPHTAALKSELEVLLARA
ncbi:MAG: haloacid dehalogenase-like hydrolase [Actinomycetota bacterium]|nr:haloacid dehalogenase-like hydrolase [Actinomycetota bacterium]